MSAAFEGLEKTSQDRILNEHPEFHSYPENRKTALVKSEVKRVKRNSADRERYNRESTTGKAAIERTIAAAQQKVANVPAVRTVEPASVSPAAPAAAIRGKVKQAKSEMESHWTDIHMPDLRLSADNPLHQKAVDFNQDHSDLMHHVGMKLEEHRLNNEGESDTVSDIGTHITNGFEANGDHTTAHMLGDADTAKAKLKEAAHHFSQAAALMDRRYGKNYEGGHLPKVLLEHSPEQARFAFPLGNLAVHIANQYIERHRTAVSNRNVRSSLGKGMTRRILAATISPESDGELAAIKKRQFEQTEADSKKFDKPDKMFGTTALEEAKKRRTPATQETMIAERIGKRNAVRRKFAPRPAPVESSLGGVSAVEGKNPGIPNRRGTFNAATSEGKM